MNVFQCHLYKTICFIAVLAGTFTVRAQSVNDLVSPDGRIHVRLIAGNNDIKYSVVVDETVIITPSHLGLQFQNYGQTGMVLKTVAKSSHQSQWNNPLGKSSLVQNSYNEMVLSIQLTSMKNFPVEIIVRAYDDGIGFRYSFPNKNADTLILQNEETSFAFAANYDSYAGHHPRHTFAGSQEWEFEPRKLNEIVKDSVVDLPLLVKTPVAWVALTESDLLNWSGMWLCGAGDQTQPGKLITRLAPRPDKKGLVKFTAPHDSPWRVLMIGRKPGDLIESNLVLNLATPSVIGDASWIKPGMMAWDHWWSGDVLMNTATLKQYIQLAADMGWPYQLIDWQWYGPFNKPDADITKVNPAVDMEEVRRFAKEKNVKLWLWLYWTDVERNSAYKKAFALYEQWGIAGIKIDFMDRDDQDMVNWYEKIAKASAQHHLMLDFHGAYKPTGLERTYPNQITREGILGNEYNRWSRRVTSKHKLTLLFTRFLAGPADYTPGGFLNRQPDTFKPNGAAAEVQGSRASELALFVVYNSPITVACDLPDHYKNQPGADFLKQVPTVWDETKVLQAEVGNYAIIARRSGKDWYIGALTDSLPRQITVPLTFLGAGSYKLTGWKDARDSNTNAEHIETEEKTVALRDRLVIDMVGNGGYAARLRKE